MAILASKNTPRHRAEPCWNVTGDAYLQTPQYFVEATGAPYNPQAVEFCEALLRTETETGKLQRFRLRGIGLRPQVRLHRIL